MAEILPIRKETAYQSIPVSILLTLITCGIYNLFWNAHQMKVLNQLLQREEFSFWKWLFLSIITLGIYHIYYQYCMGGAICEVHKKYQLSYPLPENLPILSLVLTIFGMTIVTDCIHQHEIHKLFQGA